MSIYDYIDDEEIIKMADEATLWTEEKLTTRALDEQQKNLFNILISKFQNNKLLS